MYLGKAINLVKHWEFKGKHTGTFFGIPATGKDVDVEGATLVKMRGGKIAEEQDFFDNYEFMKQLGFDKIINMKAKSIKGKSTEEIQSALQQSMADGFKPTLAIVFISKSQDRKA